MKPREGAEPSDPQEINWEQIKQQVIEKLRECVIAKGKDSDKEDFEKWANNVNNFNQYFPYNKNGKNEFRAFWEKKNVDGYTVDASEEENEITTIGERAKQFKRLKLKQAEGAKDFNMKYSEKFLNIPIAKFFRDVNSALELVGITRQDLEEDNYPKEKQEAIARAFQYLIAIKGYNYHDLAG